MKLYGLNSEFCLVLLTFQACLFSSCYCVGSWSPSKLFLTNICIKGQIWDIFHRTVKIYRDKIYIISVTAFNQKLKLALTLAD